MANLTYFRNNRTNFALLGKVEKAENLDVVHDFSILTDKKSDKIPSSFWATLGWEDNSDFRLDGELQFSEIGNLKSKGSTGKIVSELKLIHPEIQHTPLIERYINFDQIDFSEANSSKKMRLDLFLKPDEGALVYLQHSIKGDYDEENAEIEFVLPSKTNNKYDTKRNRLSYYIDFVPKKLEQFAQESDLDLSGIKESSFILKLLTFKRGEGRAENLYKNAIKNISFSVGENLLDKIGEQKYKLLVFDATINSSDATKGGEFKQIASFHELQKGVKTLFLIHGTFSSTLNTFKHLHEKKSNQKSFLQTLIEEGTYQQIIAFDHPTISHDVETNIEYLLTHYLQDNSFNTTEIDVLACSRGALVAEGLSNFDSVKDRLKINKIMLFSAANGVNYFQFGKTVCHFLSIWKKTATGPFLKVVLTLAEFSADFFLSLPGCQQMKPDSDRLKLVLNKKPHRAETHFYLFVSDWKFHISRGNFFRRSGALFMDFTIKQILGNEHDWVVGCSSQKKVPKDATLSKITLLDSMHCRYFDDSYTFPKTIHQDLREVMER
jgi:hypothetical protein